MRLSCCGGGGADEKEKENASFWWHRKKSPESELVRRQQAGRMCFSARTEERICGLKLQTNAARRRTTKY